MVARPKIRKKRFYIDNEFLANGYASYFRKLSLLDVYCVLAKYANHQSQICFPSIDTIIQESGVKNRNTVVKAINKLEELNLIRVFRSKGRSSNRYFLLDNMVWLKFNSDTGDTVKPYQTNRVVNVF